MKQFLSLLLFLSLSSFMSAQSVQDVPATEANGDPIINALITYVVADTNAAGEQLHDIYKLERGKTYFYNQEPVFNNPITLIADAPGTTDETKPPKIILTTNDEGEADYINCIVTYSDLTVRNIAFSTTTVDGQYSWADVVVSNGEAATITMEGCIFELSGWGMIEVYGDGSELYFDKCHIRNATVYDYGDEWCPFFFETGTTILNALSVRNCTFFSLQGTVLNAAVQATVNYFLFDHNTLVNVVKGFSEMNSHTNSKVTNNIFYNVNTHGLTPDQVATSEDEINVGVIRADTLLANEVDAPDSLDAIMNESDRLFHLKNNAYFFTQGVIDYWAEFDSVVAAPWMDERTQAMFDDDASYPGFVEENNVNIDPVFANFGGTDDMVAQMRNHRENNTFGFWGWDPDSSLFDFEGWDVQHWAYLQWPLPEDFSYSATIPSTDGYHVGSLVYYPTELAQYEANVTGIEDDFNASIPTEFSLKQNYPNPFNPSTNIKFSLGETGTVSLTIYNSLGQEVQSVVNNEILSAGSHERIVNMSNLSSGVYFYSLKQNDNVQVQKMMLLK